MEDKNTFKITLPPPLAQEVRRAFADPRNPNGRLRHGEFTAFIVEIIGQNKDAMMAFAAQGQNPQQIKTFSPAGKVGI